MSQLTSIVCRALFVVAFVLAGVAVWEKLVNVAGYTVLRGVWSPWRLLEFSAVILLFVIALLLREIRRSFAPKAS